MALADATFGELLPRDPLWPASPSTFRSRFGTLGADVGLPVDRRTPLPRFEKGGVLDLGSLRTGGATHHWMTTGNAPQLQQLGRWLSIRTMGIYLQELAAITLLSRLSRDSREKIAELHELAPSVLRYSCRLLEAGVPPSEWAAAWREIGRGGELGADGRR